MPVTEGGSENRGADVYVLFIRASAKPIMVAEVMNVAANTVPIRTSTFLLRLYRA